MIKLIVTLSLAFISFYTFSQNLKPPSFDRSEFGINLQYHHYSIYNTMNLGFSYTYKFSERFGLRHGLMYSKRLGPDFIDGVNRYDKSKLAFSTEAVVSFGKNNQWDASLGVFTQGTVERTLLSSFLNADEFGFQLGISKSFKINSKTAIEIGVLTRYTGYKGLEQGFRLGFKF